MLTAILHLSDIHFDSPRHPLLRRVNPLARAVASTGRAVDHIVVLVSGDVAQSGTEEQYRVASTFFDELTANLKELLENPGVSYVFVPGNHDCDLAAASDVRQPDVIEPKLSSLDLDGHLVSHFLAVQASFFRFTSRYEGEAFTSPRAQLCHSRTITVGDRQLRFSCFNTAWLTQNPEKPSRLYFPPQALEALSPESTADLAISVFHHPFNWLNPQNAQEFKRRVEAMSDLMFSGHEHTADVYSKRRTAGDIVHCIEADALWDPSGGTSAFNLVLLDLAGRTYSVSDFRWYEGAFLRKVVCDWQPFQRNRTTRTAHNENNATFRQELNDLGTGFSHRHSLRELTLSDLFVYPDLARRLLQVRTAVTPQNRVRSNAVLEFVQDHNNILIIGEAKAGKTVLAKELYIDLQAKGLTPVLLKGASIRATESRVLQSISDAYAEQYAPETLQMYQQLPKSSKVLLIDDFHYSRLSVSEQADLLPILGRLAQRVIIFVDESAFQISEIASKGTRRPFAAFEHCELFPFCPSLRTRLIARWVALGASEDVSAEQLARETRARDSVLAIFLPKQSLPPYPINILGLLQAYEAQTNLNTANGSYGELCEGLITERLRKASKNRPAEIPTKYTFLARFANVMFRTAQRYLSEQDLVALKQEYSSDLDVDLDLKTIVPELLSSNIITERDGNYRFRYPSYYYFFAARYFSDAMADPVEASSARITMAHIADHLYYEPYVNILIFYLYFTHEIPTIEHILSNAKCIYGQYPVCRLESEVSFLNRLYIEPPKPVTIAEADLHEQRERHQELADEHELSIPLEPSDDGDRTITYADDLDHLKKMNIAFKTIQVLGQVLCNFPNVLRGELKVRVARECYCLGLRVLSAIMEIASENLEELREYFATIIKEQRKIALQSQLATETDTFMIRIMGGCTYSVIRRISTAVGSEQLTETYRKVLRGEDDRPSVALIDLAIKLEHFPSFPLNEIESILRRVEDNRFCYGILRELVVNSLVTRDVGNESRRRLGRLLLIEVGEITDGIKLLR